MSPQLSLVIPAYAEAAYIGSTLRQLHAMLGARRATTEVIVVTADAADGTAAIVREELARFPIAQHVEPGAKVGKGRDVRAGMLAARGDVALFMDADLATPLSYIDDALAVLAGHDIVIGRRDLARIHARWTRKLTSQLANQLIRAVLLPGMADTQCGFKAFRAATLRPLFGPLRTLGWGFDLEILARARQLGYAVGELAIDAWCDPKDKGLVGEPAWRAQLRTLGELVDIRARLGRQGYGRSVSSALASTVLPAMRRTT